MTQTNVLCIAIDGWHAGYVGAYGNTQLATPGVDRWAAAGVVCDQALGAGAGDRGLGVGEDSGASLAAALLAAGYRTTLVTDDDEVAREAESGGFSECVRVPYKPAARSADAVEGTQLFRLFSAVGNAIGDAIGDAVDETASADSERPFFLYAHARAMNGTWDAPYALRRQFVDEEDPDPPREVSFEPRRLEGDVDPDVLLGLRAAYAGQIAVLDDCLAALDELLAECGLAERTLVVLVGTRGFPLGEHGVFGLGLGPLHEESLHVPWIMRFPSRQHATVRLPQLVRHADLLPTLVEACGLSVRTPVSQLPEELQSTDLNPTAVDAASLMPLIATESGPWRDRVIHRCGDEEAITTPAWRLRTVSQRTQLYVKPDDRWEVNDVACRCGDVVEKLVAAMHATREAGERGEAPPPLDDVLREGL